MAHLKPVARVTLVDQVATQLAERISQGHWSQGERLPSEPELCRVLHIGRSTLREALKSLAFIGMVRMRPGEGTFVANGYAAISGQIMARTFLKTEKDFTDLWETRATLETRMAALAAERADDQDLERLDSLLSQMQARLESNDPSYTNLDMEFHFAVAAGSKNRMLQEMLVPLRGMVLEWMAKSHQMPGKRENALKEHRRIAEAIRQRDPEKARKAMETHLLTFRHVYTVLEKMSSPATAETVGSL
jgi:DNA-binding FadR family transcriptional regulator